MSCSVNQSSKKVSNGITCLSLTTFEAWNNRCFAQHFCLSSLLLHGLSSSAKASSIWFSLNVKGHCQARGRQIDLTMGIVTPESTFEAWNNRCFAQHFCLSSLLLHGLSSSAKASSIWFSLNVKGHCQARGRQIDLTMGIVTPESFCSERYAITLSSSISRISRYGCFSFDALHRRRRLPR